MNRIENKNSAPGAALLFEKEILEVAADVPRDELCHMVDEYIYYQTDGMTRDEARTIVDRTCRTA